jgi:hypothetical protein
MRWPQWNPDRAGIIGAVGLTVAIVIVFALVMIHFPNLQQQRANAGFGPDWDCVVQPKGDPVCTKKLGR